MRCNEQCIRPHLHTSSPSICINKLKTTLFKAGIVLWAYVWRRHRCIFSTSDVSNISLIKDLIMQSLYAYGSWRKATGAYRTPRLEWNPCLLYGLYTYLTCSSKNYIAKEIFVFCSIHPPTYSLILYKVQIMQIIRMWLVKLYVTENYFATFYLRNTVER